MARGTNRLVNGRNVDLLKYRTQSDWELRDRVAAGSVLLRMVKFSLDIELRQLHIAKGVPEADLWPACVIRIVEGMPVLTCIVGRELRFPHLLSLSSHEGLWVS